jgi:acyl-CoA oxidase
MYAQSDAVQAVTQAFGEREVLAAGLAALEAAAPPLRALLDPVLRLYALSRLEANLGPLMADGLLGRAAGGAVAPAARALCAALAPRWGVAVRGFGVPEHLVAAPIAGDWARYNSVRGGRGGGGAAAGRGSTRRFRVRNWGGAAAV